MTTRVQLTLGVIAIAAGLLLSPVPLRAHGIGLPQVINVANGPYLVSVWTDPDPLREDETHLVVAVMDPATRAPLVSDITVSVELQANATGETVQATAHSDNSVNQLLYVVEFNNLVSAGTWQATIIVDGPWGSAADVAFPLEVTPARGFNWMWLGLGGLGVAVVVWLALSGRAGQRQPDRRTYAPPRS